jgi:RNA recognition motif-containing protein
VEQAIRLVRKGCEHKMGDRDSLDEKDRSRERSRRERPSRFSEPSRERSLDRGRERGGMKSSNCRVYVSNIPYEYRWQDLKDLFRSQVGDVQFVELFVDENDKSRGCGIVEFSDSQCVKKCLEVMQRFEVKTRKLIIKEDSGNIRDKHGNIIGGSGSKRGRDENRYRDERYDSQQSLSSRAGVEAPENKWGNTYGLSPHFLESLRIDTPLCNRVFVANVSNRTHCWYLLMPRVTS